MIIVFLIICYIIAVASTQQHQHDINDDGGGGVLPKPCNLRCWLASLTLTLPSQSFQNGSFSAWIDDFTCSGITVGQIYSEFRQPYAVHMTASGVGLTCSFNWRVQAFSVLKEHGTASVSVANSQLAGLLALHRPTNINNSNSDRARTSSSINREERQQQQRSQSEMKFSSRARFVEEAADGAAAAGARVGAPIDQLPTSITVSDCLGQFYATIDFQCGIICKIIELFDSQINSFVNDELDQQVCLQITTLAAVNGTAALDEFNVLFVDPLLLPPPPPALSVLARDSASLINNSVVSLVDYVLDEVVGYNGSLSVNRIANYFTNNTGYLYLDPAAIRELFQNFSHANFSAVPSVSFVINGTGTVTLQIESLNVSGLNTWSAFDVFRPLSDWTLRSRTATDQLGIEVAFSLTGVAWNNGSILNAPTLTERGLFKVHLSRCELDATLGLSFSNEALSNLILPDQALCSLHALRAATITQLQFNATFDLISIIARGGDLEQDVDELLDATIRAVFAAYADALPALLGGVIAEPMRRLANTALVEFVRNVTHPSNCSAVLNLLPPVVPFWAQRGTRYATLGLAALATLVTLAMCLCEIRSRRSRKSPAMRVEVYNSRDEIDADLADDNDADDIETTNDVDHQPIESSPASNAVNDVGPGIDRQRRQRQNTSASYIDETPSLAFHRRLPFIVRLLVPLLIVATMATFVSSNTSTGASVVPVITLGATTIRPPPLFEFSLVNSVRDMWNAKTYALSLLIAIFSCAWVYLKLSLMLMCWFVPPRVMARERRERLLAFLDALGKWSLIDMFVLVMMMVAFRFQLAVPMSFAFNGDNARASFDVYVKAEWGVYSFIGATIASLTLTHIIIALDRVCFEQVAPPSVAAAARKAANSRRDSSPDSLDVDDAGGDMAVNFDDVDNPNAPLLQNPVSGHSPELSPRVRRQRARSNTLSLADVIDDDEMRRHLIHVVSARVRARPAHSRHMLECSILGQVVVTILLVSSATLVAVGSFIHSFKFDFGGGAGLALEYQKGTTELVFSIYSMAMAIVSAAEPADYIGAEIVRVIFFGLAIVVPLLLVFFLGVLWFVPMRIQYARRMYYLCEILHAWAALDVFGVSLVTALLEVGQFAKFIIGNRCDVINGLLKQYFDTALGGHDVCFDVTTVLLPGCWVLVSAFIALLIASTVAMSVCHSALQLDQRRFVLASSPTPSWYHRFLVWIGLSHFLALASRD